MIVSFRSIYQDSPNYSDKANKKKKKTSMFPVARAHYILTTKFACSFSF